MQINARISVPHLRAAAALADSGSFTAAAQLLGLSQSSLSRKIGELERMLRTQLFERTTRSVRVTAGGRAMLEQIRAILASFDHGMRQLERQSSGEQGVVTIGCLPSIAATYLPGFIRDFSREYPEVRIEVRDALNDQVAEQVFAGEVDFGVVAGNTRNAGLRYERVGADQFFCALPKGHHLGVVDQLSWSRLDGEALITFGANSSISRPVETALEAAGVRPSSTMVGHNVGAVAGLVASGLGVTAVPGLVRPLMEFAQLDFIPLRPVVEREISMVRRSGEGISAAAERFMMALGRRHPL